jgi:hypothetical protein
MKKGRYKRRSLRVALVYRGEVLQDRVLEPGHAQEVSLGEAPRNALRMPTTHLDEGYVLLRPSARSPGRHTLRLGAHFTGKLRIAGRNCHLDDPHSREDLHGAHPGLPTTMTLDDGARISQPTVDVEVGPGDWGMLHVGPFDVIFQYIQPVTATTATTARRPGWLREAAQHLSSPIGLGVLVGLMAQSSLMFWANAAEEPSLEQLIEHSVEDRLSTSAPADALAPRALTVTPSAHPTVSPQATQPAQRAESQQPAAKPTSASPLATPTLATLANAAKLPTSAPPPLCTPSPADTLTTTLSTAANSAPLASLAPWPAPPPTPPNMVKLWTAQAAGLTRQGLDSGRHAPRAHRHAQPAHDGHRSLRPDSPQLVS